MTGPLQRIRDRQFVRRVHDEVIREVTSRGFVLVADELTALQVSVPAGAPESGTFSRNAVEAMWFRCEQEGVLNETAILETAARAGLKTSVIGEGLLGDFFRRLVEWLNNPENQEKLLAVIKFVMTLLAMFGI